MGKKRLAFFLFLVFAFIFFASTVFAKDIASKSDMLKETLTALCSRMEACGHLGSQTKDECVKQEFDPDSPFEKIPDITPKELKACVKAINALPCDKVRHSTEPPKKCRFFKDM